MIRDAATTRPSRDDERDDDRVDPPNDDRRTVLGRHLMLEVYDCPSQYLDDADEIRQLLLDAALGAGATVIDTVFHRFSPQGVSGVVVIAESHLAIHTWPELGCAAIDMFSCAPEIDLDQIAERLAQGLRARRIDAKVTERGRMPPAAS